MIHHARTRGAVAGLVLLAMGGCETPDTSVELELALVERETIQLDVTTTPGAMLRVDHELDVGTADENGHARVSVPVPQARSDWNPADLGYLSVSAYRETWFGLDEEFLAEGQLELPFDMEFVRNAPANPEGSWLTALGTDDHSTPRDGCLSFGRGEISEEEHRIGVAQFDDEGGALMGAPGTEVRLGQLELTIGSSGLLAWNPTADELERMITASFADGANVAVRVEAPGQAAVESRVTLTLLQCGQARLAERVRSGVESRERWPAAVAHEGGAFALFAGANGDFVAAGDHGTSPLGAARFVATEESLSHVVEGSCSLGAWGERNVRTGVVTAHSNSVTPPRHTTRVTLRDAETFEEIANETFPPGTACAEAIYPDREQVAAWIVSQIESSDD